MKYIFNYDEENRFKTISSFKECIIRGVEPVLYGTDCNMVYASTEINTACGLDIQIL